MKEAKIREEMIGCRELLTDLFQGGLSMAPDGMYKRLEAFATTFRQYGMEWLSKELVELSGLLEERRHSVESRKEEELCGKFIQVFGFLEEAIRQAGMDMAGAMICERDDEY